MQVGDFTSFRDYVGQQYKADANGAETIRKTGQSVINNALHTYHDPNRSQADADAATRDLMDLSAGMKLLASGVTSDTSAKSDALQARVAQMNQTGVGLSPAHQEPFENARQLTSLPYLPCTSGPIAQGYTEYGAEQAAVELPKLDDQAGVKAFIRDLGAIVGTYAAAVAIPGVPAASVATVPVETFNQESHSQSSSGFSEASQATHHTLLISRGQSTSRANGASQSSSDSSTTYKKDVAQDTIHQALFDLMQRLDDVSIEPARYATIVGTRDVKQYEQFRKPKGGGTQSFGLVWMIPKADKPWLCDNYTHVPQTHPISDPVEVQASHLRLPLTGTSDYSA